MSDRKATVANPTYRPIPHPVTPYKSFSEFYPFYLGEHSSRINRIFHLAGTSVASLIYLRIALSLLSRIVASRTNHVAIREAVVRLVLSRREIARYLVIGLLQGYAFAWIGHFFVEKNRPATFKYPLFSLRGDFRLLWEVLTAQRQV